uniref:Uncharacterized protein n=1 Tax=Setaria italica TaxID=4555 RepID=K3YB32_SETIT
MKPKAEAANDEAAAVVDQLLEAAKLADAGDAFGAREILALRLALSPTGETPAPAVATPYDVVLKLGAYKAFSEVSPVLQFAHLTGASTCWTSTSAWASSGRR